VNPACLRTRDVAAELALGIAEGDQRAEALDHLATCATCRAEVDQLAAAADRVLLVAPEVEPPVGFESRVLDHLETAAVPTAPGARRRPGRLLAVAAAVVVALLVFGLGVVAGRLGGPAATHSVATGELTASSGMPVGRVTAISGDQSWLVMKVGGEGNTSLEPGEYRVVCEYGNGRVYTAGTVTVGPGGGPAAWSTSLWYRLDDLTQVRLEDASGETTAIAPFPPG
jgi:hypothetical protein